MGKKTQRFEAGYSATEQLGKGQEVATVSAAIARHGEKIARSECYLSCIGL